MNFMDCQEIVTDAASRKQKTCRRDGHILLGAAPEFIKLAVLALIIAFFLWNEIVFVTRAQPGVRVSGGSAMGRFDGVFAGRRNKRHSARPPGGAF
jgi:hypothetical protein